MIDDEVGLSNDKRLRHPLREDEDTLILYQGSVIDHQLA